MATEKELNSAKEELAKQLDVLLNMKVREAAIRPNLGDINFSAALPVIDRALGLFAMLHGVSLDYVSHNRLTTLTQTIKQAIEQLKQIEAFSLNVDNPRAQRDNIINTIEGQYTGWFDHLYPIIGFAIRSSTDFAALERDLRTKIAQAEVTSKELLEQQQAAAAKAQETLGSIQKAAAEAGVSQEAVHFKKAADAHEQVARKWLAATAVMAALTVVWGAVVLWFLPVSATDTAPQIVQHTIAKLIILSGLYYALVWCGRNYSATQHNLVVNRHRQNALSTFETFVKAAASEDVKQAVLVQATTSIFASQPSGYSMKEVDSEQPSKVIEILRSIGTVAKPTG